MAWTAPRTWVAGETVTAAVMNTHIRDNFKALGDAWTSYTPALGNWTLSDGATTGAYMQTGKFVVARFKYTVGSADTKSGTLLIGLPVTATSAYAQRQPIGSAALADAGVADYTYAAGIDSTTRLHFANASGILASATSPFTWGTGDTLTGQVVYEAA